MKYFKSKQFLWSVIVLLIASLIWLLGGQFDISTDLRLAAIVVVLVISMVFLSYNSSKGSKFSDALKETIKKQADQQKQGVRPDKQAKIDELQQKLEDAIDYLKQSKLGDGRRSKAALYALPWYIFIGPPQSGKTTAIKNSGLTNSREDLQVVKGVGGTRNCDWIFSNYAIFLDTAGRYVTEHEDREEWLAFLNTLKDNRTEQPINGVMIGIGLDMLVGKSLEDVEMHAAKIRRRIDELVMQLGITFPVYIVFTKCDLWNGFVQFFSELDSQAREQVWGTTFGLDQADSGEITDIFDKEYELLLEQLIDQRTEKLSRQHNREERHHIFVFPLQFAEAKRNLSRFVGRVFQPNPYQDTPIFRGFYFTSGTQEGVPMLNEVINNIAASFGLPSAERNSASQPQKKKTFFLKNLFTRVVIPDQYLVSKTKRTRLLGSRRKAAVYTATLIGLGAMLLLLSFAFARSKQNLNRTNELLASVMTHDWGDNQGLVSGLDSMIELDKEIKASKGLNRFLLLGLDRGRSIAGPAEREYDNQVRLFVKRFVYDELVQKLDVTTRARSLDGIQKQHLYEDIKTLMLMSSEVQRLEGDGYDSYLISRLKELVRDEAHAFVATDNAQALHNEQINNQLTAFVELLTEQPERAFAAPNPTLLRQGRILVDESQTVTTLFNRIVRSQGALDLPEVSLGELVGPGNQDVFSTDPNVPGIYTQRGWGYFKETIDKETKNPSREDWVLGRSTATTNEPDPEELTEQLESLYFENYAQVWLRFLESIQYRSDRDIQSISDKISILGNKYTSPLIAVLMRVSSETTFQTDSERLDNAVDGVLDNTRVPGGRAGRAAAGAARSATEGEQHPLSIRFRWLHDLNIEMGVSEGALGNVFNELDALSLKLDQIGQDRELIAEYTSTVLSQGGTEMHLADRSIQRLNSFPGNRIRVQLFESLIDASLSALMRETHTYYNTLWEQQVLRQYQDRIQGRYPFDSNSPSDLELNDFIDFFHPEEGVLAQFKKEYLDNFRGGRWGNQRFSLNPKIDDMYEQAEELTDQLMRGDQLFVTFSTTPEQTDHLDRSAPNPTYLTLAVHGTEDRYDQGPVIKPPAEFIWPRTPTSARISLETRLGSDVVVETTGPWAWFRLLDKAEVDRDPSGFLRVAWILGDNDYRVKYKLDSKNKDALFLNSKRFFQFECPRSLF